MRLTFHVGPFTVTVMIRFTHNMLEYNHHMHGG